MNGFGSEILRVGKVVCLSRAGRNTSCVRSAPNDLPVILWAISPTTMLSVFEYS